MFDLASQVRKADRSEFGSVRSPTCKVTCNRQGANGYVLSMGTKIWDPERSPEQGPEQTPEQGPE